MCIIYTYTLLCIQSYYVLFLLFHQAIRGHTYLIYTDAMYDDLKWRKRDEEVMNVVWTYRSRLVSFITNILVSTSLV